AGGSGPGADRSGPGGQGRNRPHPRAIAKYRMTTVFIISAPSGSGKSTLVARLLNEVEGLTLSVSCTTRAPRGEEKPGPAYDFIGRDEFLKRVEAGEFLEHADVFGNFYGTHRSA